MGYRNLTETSFIDLSLIQMITLRFVKSFKKHALISVTFAYKVLLYYESQGTSIQRLSKIIKRKVDNYNLAIESFN